MNASDSRVMVVVRDVEGYVGSIHQLSRILCKLSKMWLKREKFELTRPNSRIDNLRVK
jgi:hypothetical protein